MEDKVSEEELQQRLDTASRQVSVGALYQHYRGNQYKVTDLAILESNNEICVIYEALYGKGLTFIRPVSIWLENVELEGKIVKRFTKVA